MWRTIAKQGFSAPKDRITGVMVDAYEALQIVVMNQKSCFLREKCLLRRVRQKERWSFKREHGTASVSNSPGPRSRRKKEKK